MLKSTVEDVLEDLRQGKMAIVTDDEKRENEGDLVMAAEKVRFQDIYFMATQGGGLICAPITKQRAQELALPPMVAPKSFSQNKTASAFTVSIDLAELKTSGASPRDRAATARALTDRAARAESFHRPGHLFPLVAQEGGVLERPGHTEAAIDLTRLAGLFPAAVICEAIGHGGGMATARDLQELAKKFDLKIISVADIIEFRLERDEGHGGKF